MSKRLIAVFLSLLVLISSTVSVQVYAGLKENYVKIIAPDGKEYLRKIDAINAKVRQTNQLILYTPEFGESTGQNEWGTEVVVEGQQNVPSAVKEIRIGPGIKNAIIPSDGYVLSANGTSNTWLKDIIKNGGSGYKVQILKDYIANPEIKSTMTLTTKNPQPPFEYPGGRGLDYLVYYDKDYGNPSTGTNPYGYEVVIDGGIIVKIGGNNNVIPEGGFVLSANRNAKPQLGELPLGTKVTVEGDTVTAVISVESYIEGGKIILKETEDKYSKLCNEFRDVDRSTLEKLIADIKDNLSQAQQQLYKSVNCSVKIIAPDGTGFERKIDGINAKIRQANQLILYTPEFGESTQQNQYGIEVEVRGRQDVPSAVKGIYKSKGNAVIPSDGYVLSSNGTSSDWLKANIPVDGDYSGYKVQILKEYIVNDSLNQALSSAEKAISLAAEADLYYMESRKVEGRGVWYVASETTQEAVAATMERMKNAGINMLFLETIYQSHAIYPSSVTLKQNAKFIGFDPLQAFIEEGHKRGIEVHAWVTTFAAGRHSSFNNGQKEIKDNEPYTMGYILDEHPDWVVVNRQGTRGLNTSDGDISYMFNPAIPEIKDFLSITFIDLIQKYDLDGLQLDYIRYPDSSSAAFPYEKDYSYDPYSISQVQQKYGFNPFDITPTDNPEQWDIWKKWKQDQVTSVVERISREAKALNPDIKISAAVSPIAGTAKNTLYQDWPSWPAKGYVDFLCPMAYYLDTAYLQEVTKTFSDIVNNNAYVYGGVGPYLAGYTPTLLSNQVNALNNINAEGVVPFSYANMDDSYIDNLKKGPYRNNEAFIPHKNPIEALGRIIADVKRKIGDIYVQYGGMESTVAENFKAQLDSIMTEANKYQKVEVASFEAIKKIDSVVESFNNSNINPEVKNRIAEDLSFAKKLCTIAMNLDKYTTSLTWNNGSVEASNVTQTGLTLTWSGASNDTAAYAVYKDGSLLETVTSSVYNVTGLTPGTTYRFKIEAGDTLGNWSNTGPNVSVTTLSIPEVRTVIFDSNGGSPVLHAMVSSGEKVTRPSEPVKSGNVFDGWRIGDALGQLYDFDTPVTENITLYASWKPGIVVTDVSCSNCQASVSFDIKSANGRGYAVYISESIDGPYILYNNVNYNAKGVHIKDLTNGKTYYVTIEYANGATKLKSDPVKLSPYK